MPAVGFSLQDCIGTYLQGDEYYPSHERQQVAHRPPACGGR
jgi:hypothetical protein